MVILTGYAGESLGNLIQGKEDIPPREYTIIRQAHIHRIYYYTHNSVDYMGMRMVHLIIVIVIVIVIIIVIVILTTFTYFNHFRGDIPNRSHNLFRANTVVNTIFIHHQATAKVCQFHISIGLFVHIDHILWFDV